MFLKTITAHNFRNFTNATFSFDPLLTLIVGPNAIGKTNLLEAIYFVTQGRGFREEKEEELIQTKKTTMTVSAEYEEGAEKNFQQAGIHLNQSATKYYLFNKVKKRAHEYIKKSVPVAIFSPTFLSVIDGQMQERRDFFDRMIGWIDAEHRKRLVNYEQGLRRRNKLLERVADTRQLKEQLVFWDEYLIKEAQYITEKRHSLSDFLNTHPRLERKMFHCVYRKNEISKQALEATFEKQCILKKTLVGPQRDVFEVYIDQKNAHRFGSRSEQRLTLFWLVVNQIRLYEKYLNRQPLVLLDDIFSELDIVNKSLIMELVKNHQTVITTIEEDFVDTIDMPKTVIRL